jgi:hypothetical protein
MEEEWLLAILYWLEQPHKVLSFKVPYGEGLEGLMYQQ